jgi:hypothetical protein
MRRGRLHTLTTSLEESDPLSQWLRSLLCSCHDRSWNKRPCSSPAAKEPSAGTLIVSLVPCYVGAARGPTGGGAPGRDGTPIW